MFEHWASVLVGILEFNEIGNFLGNVEESHRPDTEEIAFKMEDRYLHRQHDPEPVRENRNLLRRYQELKPHQKRTRERHSKQASVEHRD